MKAVLRDCDFFSGYLHLNFFIMIYCIKIEALLLNLFYRK